MKENMKLEDKVIPAILTFHPPQSSISTYRALKHARAMLEKLQVTYMLSAEEDHGVQVALDDLELMMRKVA